MKGNAWFLSLVRNHSEAYQRGASKADKTRVVESVLSHIRESGGKFLKRSDGQRWYEIDNKGAREKVGHAMRDFVSKQQGRSKQCPKVKARNRKRREMKEIALAQECGVKTVITHLPAPPSDFRYVPQVSTSSSNMSMMASEQHDLFEGLITFMDGRTGMQVKTHEEPYYRLPPANVSDSTFDAFDPHCLLVGENEIV